MAYHNITDGEKVNYRYDLGGNLKNLVGANSYIENIVYDHYEQRTGVFFGNGIHSTFSYSPTNRRLQEHRLEHPNNGNGLLKNNYSFDFVGNITNILNYAVQSPNEMGGAYNFNYGYDQLNRLIAASGEFGVDKNTSTYQNTPYAVSNSEFALEMGYTPSGGIDFKNQNHLQNQQTNPQNTYANRYHYIGGTHKLATIENQSAGTTEEFKYDENGNVIMHWNPTDGEKNMFWDEQDRMKAFYSNETGTFQYYTYDDKGERIIKYNLKEGAKLYQNGALVDGYMEMIGYKLYPNAYWTLSSDGSRTKHYFAGDQRVASRVLVEAPFMKQSASKTTDTREETTIPNPEEDLKVYLRKAGLADGKIAAEFSKAASTISGLYYLHGDHLGTATYVTDSNGETTQFFLNLPFGETMAEQNLPGAYENPYKFNAKELDVETGLYYYGARYYNPRTSIWLSVDPLAEKFPGWSPYNYAMNNPLVFIDPTGMAPEWHEDGKGNLVKDEGDNAKTLKEHINKNYENADVSQSAANTLYATMEDGKVNIDQLNPETLNQNLFGTNYPGPNNPKKYNGESDYSVAPTEFEKPAFVHDQDYDKLGAVGAGGLFLDNKTAAADRKFVESMDKLVTKYKESGETKMMIKAVIVRDGLNAASQPKQMIQTLKNSVKQAITPPAILTRPRF